MRGALLESRFYDQRDVYEIWNSKANSSYAPETMPPTVYKWKIQYGHQVAILKMTLLKMDKLLPIYISIVLLKFRIDIQS